MFDVKEHLTYVHGSVAEIILIILKSPHNTGINQTL